MKKQCPLWPFKATNAERSFSVCCRITNPPRLKHFPWQPLQFSPVPPQLPPTSGETQQPGRWLARQKSCCVLLPAFLQKLFPHGGIINWWKIVIRKEQKHLQWQRRTSLERGYLCLVVKSGSSNNHAICNRTTPLKYYERESRSVEKSEVCPVLYAGPDHHLTCSSLWPAVHEREACIIFSLHSLTQLCSLSTTDRCTSGVLENGESHLVSQAHLSLLLSSSALFYTLNKTRGTKEEEKAVLRMKPLYFTKNYEQPVVPHPEGSSHTRGLPASCFTPVFFSLKRLTLTMNLRTLI